MSLRSFTPSVSFASPFRRGEQQPSREPSTWSVLPWFTRAQTPKSSASNGTPAENVQAPQQVASQNEAPDQVRVGKPAPEGKPALQVQAEQTRVSAGSDTTAKAAQARASVGDDIPTGGLQTPQQVVSQSVAPEQMRVERSAPEVQPALQVQASQTRASVGNETTTGGSQSEATDTPLRPEWSFSLWKGKTQQREIDSSKAKAQPEAEQASRGAILSRAGAIASNVASAAWTGGQFVTGATFLGARSAVNAATSKPAQHLALGAVGGMVTVGQQVGQAGKIGVGCVASTLTSEPVKRAVRDGAKVAGKRLVQAGHAGAELAVNAVTSESAQNFVIGVVGGMAATGQCTVGAVARGGQQVLEAGFQRVTKSITAPQRAERDSASDGTRDRISDARGNVQKQSPAQVFPQKKADPVLHSARELGSYRRQAQQPHPPASTQSSMSAAELKDQLKNLGPGAKREVLLKELYKVNRDVYAQVVNGLFKAIT